MNHGIVASSIRAVQTAGLFGALLGAQALSAATLQITGVDTTRGEGFNVSANGVASSEFGGAIQGVSNSLTISSLFCVDLFTTIGVGNYDTTLIAPRASRHEDQAAWLFNTEVGNVTTPVYGAALQLAIWDIVHDGGDGFSTGSVQSLNTGVATPANVISLANTFLLESVGKSSENATIYINAVSSTGAPAQSLIGAFVAGTAPVTVPVTGSTPEPATWMLSGAAFACLVFWKRRRLSGAEI